MYRSIETDTWSDPWFSELGAPAKLIFLYLVTNGHVDAAGCCQITLRIMGFETGLEQEQLTKIIPKLAPQVIWWPEHNTFWVRNFLRRQSANTNPANFRKSAARALSLRPEEIGMVVRDQYPDLPILADASPTSPPPNDASTMHPDASPMDAETVSVSVSEQNQKREEIPPVSLRSTSPRGARIPEKWPTAADLDEMDAYGQSLGIRADDVASHIGEFRDYWGQATKNATSLDWVKRWRAKFAQDVRDGRVGGRPPPNGHGPPRRMDRITTSDTFLVNGKEPDDEQRKRYDEADRLAFERAKQRAATEARL